MKPIETQESLPGSSILLTENARKDWAQWQMEVVAVGAPPVCEKPKKCGRSHEWRLDARQIHPPDERLTPGAWVIVKPRSTIPVSSDSPLVIVRHEDVIAVFRE